MVLLSHLSSHLHRLVVGLRSIHARTPTSSSSSSRRRRKKGRTGKGGGGGESLPGLLRPSGAFHKAESRWSSSSVSGAKRWRGWESESSGAAFGAALAHGVLCASGHHGLDHGDLVAPLLLVVEEVDLDREGEAELLVGMLTAMAELEDPVAGVTLGPIAADMLAYVVRILGSLRSLRNVHLPVIGALRGVLLRLASTLLRVGTWSASSAGVVDALFDMATGLVRSQFFGPKSSLGGPGSASETAIVHSAVDLGGDGGAVVNVLTTLGSQVPAQTEPVFRVLCTLMDDFEAEMENGSGNGNGYALASGESGNPGKAAVEAVVTGMAVLTAAKRSLRRQFLSRLEDVLFARPFMAALSFSVPREGDLGLRTTFLDALSVGLLDYNRLNTTSVALLSAFVLELTSRVTELGVAASSSNNVASRPRSDSASRRSDPPDAVLSRTLGSFIIGLLGGIPVVFAERSVVKVIFNFFVNALSGSGSSSLPSEFHHSVLSALGRMAVNTFGAPSPEFGETLSIFARFAQREVLSTTSPSSKAVKKNNKKMMKKGRGASLFAHVMDELLLMGKRLEGKEQVMAIATRLAEIFVSSAKRIVGVVNEDDTGASSSSVGSSSVVTLSKRRVQEEGEQLVRLLEPLRELLSRGDVEDVLFPPVGSAKVFHSLWMYCVMFEFNREHGAWAPGVYETVSALAVRLPVLIAPAHPHSFSELVTEINASILPRLEKGFVDSLMGSLAAGLPSVSRTTLSSLGSAKAFYLYCVYSLEMLRAGAAFMLPVFVYVEDVEISLEEELSVAVEALPAQLTAEFLSALSLPGALHASPLGAGRTCPGAASGVCGCKGRVEERHVMFLTAVMVSQSESARAVASRELLSLLKSSASLLASVNGLRFALDLLEVLAASMTVSVREGSGSGSGVFEQDSDYDDGTTAVSVANRTARPDELSVRLPGLAHTVVLPLDLVARKTVLSSLASLVSSWLSAGMQAAPGQVQAVLSDLLLDFERLASRALPHLDGMALRVGSITDPVLDALVSPESIKEHARLAALSHRASTTFASQLVRESYHAGQVRGLRAAGIDVAGYLKGELSAAVGKGWNAHTAELCYAAGAELIAAKARGDPLDGDLISALTYVPITLFTSDSVENGVSIWVWLLTRVPEVEPRLLASLVELWDWSMERQLGLFCPDPYASGRAGDAGPHGIWITFFMERLASGSRHKEAVRSLLHSVVTHSLRDPHGLSHHPSSLGPRMSLLLLGLRLASSPFSASSKDGVLMLSQGSQGGVGVDLDMEIARMRTRSRTMGGGGGGGGMGVGVGEKEEDVQHHEGPLMDVVASLVLRDYVYNGLLTWFVCGESAFRGEEDVNRAALALLVECAREMRRDGDSLGALVSALQSVEDMGGRDGDLLAPLVQFLPLLFSLQDRGQLGRVLLASEVERLSVWTNPLNDPERAVAGTEEIPRPSPSSNASLWHDLMAVAWATLPRLAVQLAIRFPAATLRRQVEAYVRANAAVLVGVPEAVPFLVTEANVRANLPALRLLVSWAPCDAGMAVSLLDWKAIPPHNLVVQYALRVLRSIPVRDVIFFIPQLVQALRNDPHNYVGDFLREAAGVSSAVAHQILWNMKTYQERDEESGEYLDPEFGPVCTRLEGSILSGYTDAQRAFYDDEWGFFEQITQISGVLVPLKNTPDEQKRVFYSELDKIVVDPEKNLYLPSDVTALVRGIKYGTGVALKSAEKVPILVFFAVEHSDELYDEGHDEGAEAYVSGLDATGVSLSAAIEDAYGEGEGGGGGSGSGGSGGEGEGEGGEGGGVQWEGAIFKVGDDVRQDMLALQVIKMFDAVYKKVGLPVFLYPYNVVATGPGSGVIEVVRDAKSRDELGRASELGLRDLFISRYGPEDSAEFAAARHEFIASLAGYSVACYLLRLVDRHNGNIMILGTGQIVHIDFGFIGGLSSPGGDLGFERAPFKLTGEMIELMGGKDSRHFAVYKELVVKAYLSVRPLASQVVSLFQILSETGLPCFKPGLMPLLLDRFKPHLSESQAAVYAARLVDDAQDITTYLYDKLQYVQNKIWYKTTQYKEGEE